MSDIEDIESEGYESQEDEKQLLGKKEEVDDDDIEVDDDDIEVDDEVDDDDIDNIPQSITSYEGKEKSNTQLPNQVTGEDFINKIELSDDEDEDDEDIEYFQKFDEELKNNYLESIHPESKHYNYNEIANLCNVVRNSNGVIIDELHKTQSWISKYEYTRIIGQRVKQLNQGVKPFIEVPNNIIDNSIIADMELKEKKLPFIIRRPLPNGGSEFWKLKDLEIISH